MRVHIKICLLFLLLFSIGFSQVACEPVVQSEDFVLEWEQHWETYGKGGTCNFGTYNFFVGDVDNDGTLELITGGLSYDMANYTRTDLRAPFKIWNWDGESFTLETSYEWTGVTRSTFAADLDDDGLPEIITGGSMSNSTGSYSTLRLWNWDGSNLVLRSHYEGVSARSIAVCDFDQDGVSEVITVGTDADGAKRYAQLSVFGWDGDALTLAGQTEWCASNNTAATSVVTFDLDNDGTAEIITGGYDNDLMNSSGQIRVWHWNGAEFSLIANMEWRMVEDVYGLTITGDPMGNTIVNNLRVADVDGDGAAEIVTGGFAFDGEKVNAQLKIWNWADQSLVLKKSREWITDDITEVKAISLDDVDGDGSLDIITAGLAGAYGGFSDVDSPPERAQLRVWNWNGEELRLERSHDWEIGEGVVVWNVATGDVDQDGTVEIITVGCMYMAALCDPDLRIWSVATTSNSLLIPFLTVLGVTVAGLVAAFLLVKKRHS